jgi:alginate O-acetyltransferase complex protein AlgI
MLFNSYIFIFLFLPISLGIFYFLKSKNYEKLTCIWLILLSLFFYGWWNPKYLLLIALSILINFFLGSILRKNSKKIILIFGILFNLLTIGYFKYANFFLDNVNPFLSEEIILNEIILPLGISFFTFQQITYLVDSYLGRTEENKFLNYSLFVVFFPQLIAGPIVHHSEMIPQFKNKLFGFFNIKNFTVGLTVFTIGLFKKVFMADNLAVYANPAFEISELGFSLTFFDSWFAAIAYTFQLYFDFSGYSDMAIGIGLLFGIALPLNFYSPFKARNISEFWSLWHMTLSRLVRDYLYYPLSLIFTRYATEKNFGKIKVFVLKLVAPTIISFFLVGLWHGAGWHFIIFGILHGFYIVVYNIWVIIKKKIFFTFFKKNIQFHNYLAQLITFVAVTFSFVIFRSDSITSSLNFIISMIDFTQINLNDLFEATNFGTYPFTGIYFIIISICIICFLPNAYQFILKYNELYKSFNKHIPNQPNTKRKVIWKPSVFWGFCFALILILSIMNISSTNEFLYFEF